MPTYTIDHKIDTLLQLWEPFEFNDFRFSAWSIDYAAGTHDGWLAEKQIEADTVEEAFQKFSIQFHQLVDRIAFVGQCHTTADVETFLITRPNDNRFFWRYSKKRGPVPLHFNEGERQSMAALEQYEETGDVFRYMREAVNATSFYTMLVMLVSSLEAMAGITDDRGKRKIDRDLIANEILKDRDLCNKIFGYGGGIRNQILHGGFVDEKMHERINYNEIIYEAVIDYFNHRYGLTIDKGAVGRPRTIIGDYDVWQHWCEWGKGDEQISLQILHEKFRAQDASAYFTSIETPSDF